MARPCSAGRACCRPEPPERLGLSPLRQTPIDTGPVSELLDPDTSKPALPDPWAFVEQVLGWEARHVAGAPGGPAIPDEICSSLFPSMTRR